MRIVTFIVDEAMLFDTIKNVMDGDTKGLGDRLISCLLAEAGLSEKVGLGIYGITVIETPIKTVPGGGDLNPT